MVASETMVRVKRQAMGCEFELVLCGGHRDHLLDAAEEAFEEIERLEEQMSAFIPTSEISYINAGAGSRPVRVEPRLFSLLRTAARLTEETEGAFDVTSAVLTDLWNSAKDAVPSGEEVAGVLEATGMPKVLLDDEENAIRFAHPGIKLDLGALGKGYAIGEVVELLKERGVTSALVSAGTSTVYALGSPPDDDAWTVGIRNPVQRGERITSVRLRDQALSTSGSHERYREIKGTRYSHVIDPRSGQPAQGLLLACAVTTDPAESDALATAFLVLGADRTKAYCKSHSSVGAILVVEDTEDSMPEIIKVDLA